MRSNAALDRIFKLRENGTTARTEALAGITTFLTMAYIIFVNPEILANAGMDRGAVFVATCLAAATGSILMGLYANYPIALAPGMGLNAYFAYGVVQGMRTDWRVALGAVFIAAVLFFLISAFRLRAVIIAAIPASIKIGIAAGIGLLLATIGLENAGIIAGNSATLVTLGDLKAPQAILSGLGFAAILGLARRRVPGSLIIAILALTALGLPLGLSTFHGIAASPPSLAPTFLQMDLRAALDVGVLGVVAAYLFLEFFDNTGTLIGVASAGGSWTNAASCRGWGARSSPIRRRPWWGAALGTSTTTSYIESIAGVEAGGRTGLTAVVVGLLFIAALFLSPLAAIIPPYATAPALLFVACLMARSLRELDWADLTEFGPGVVAAIAIPLTFSIADGIGIGFISYALGKLAAGRGGTVSVAAWGIAGAFVAKIAFA